MILSSYPQPPQLHGLETVHRHTVERWPDSWWSSLRKSHHGGSAVIILNGFVVEGNSPLSFAGLSAVSSSGAFYRGEVIGHRSPCQTQACQPFTPSLQNCGELIGLFWNHAGSGVLLRQHRAGCDRIYKTHLHVYFIVFIFLSHSCTWLSELILKLKFKQPCVEKSQTSCTAWGQGYSLWRSGRR